MQQVRRLTRTLASWMALLGVLFYGLAPAVAAVSTRATAPAACAVPQAQAPDASHTCACRPDPHGNDDCCCHSKPASSPRELLKRLACQQPVGEDGSPLWTLTHPVVAAASGLSLRLDLGEMDAVLTRDEHPRRVMALPPTPPPQAPARA